MFLLYSSNTLFSLSANPVGTILLKYSIGFIPSSYKLSVRLHEKSVKSSSGNSPYRPSRSSDSNSSMFSSINPRYTTSCAKSPLTTLALGSSASYNI